MVPVCPLLRLTKKSAVIGIEVSVGPMPDDLAGSLPSATNVVSCAAPSWRGGEPPQTHHDETTLEADMPDVSTDPGVRWGRESV